jgi:hypothetical protein
MQIFSLIHVLSEISAGVTWAGLRAQESSKEPENKTGQQMGMQINI